jgi:hypothetical protein
LPCTAKDFPVKSGKNYQDCDDYMAHIGCGWTKKWGCPGQAGSKWTAKGDGTLGYCCCCRDEMWKAATPAPTPNPTVYIADCKWWGPHNCEWTLDYSCPNQPAGKKGSAKSGNKGFTCCCETGLWKDVTATSYTGSHPND